MKASRKARPNRIDINGLPERIDSVESLALVENYDDRGAPLACPMYMRWDDYCAWRDEVAACDPTSVWPRRGDALYKPPLRTS